MKSVGKLVMEAADLNERGQSAAAFDAACAAFGTTLTAANGKEDPALPDLKAFVDKHWELIRFLSFPAVNTPYIDLPLVIREISLNPRRRYTAKEIVVFMISHSLRIGGLPEGFGFTRANRFEKKNETLFVPVTLVSGLLAFVVVYPGNRAEKADDKYWISIADFRMFISELWGRMDLAERIRKFYLDV